MRKYDSYKDSGVEWIGEIPKDWETAPLKYTVKIKNGQDYKHIQSFDKRDIPVYGSGGIFARAKDYIYDGEALLLGRKGTIDRPLYVSGGKFWTVDTMFYAVPYNNCCCRYMYYQSLTFPFGLYSTSTALPSMTQFDLGNNPVCLPPLSEQQAIASYLDRKTSEIDKLIAEREKRIKLLEELKASIISHAVTKGLDPNAKMKPSGVEWIGDIPEGWEVEKLNYVCKVITDYVASGSFADLRNNVTYLDNPDYAMLVRTADLSNKGTISKVYINKHSYDFLSNSNLFGGEIILPNIGASIGDVYIIPNNLYERMSLAPNSIMLKTKYCNNFYYYWFKGNRASKELKLMGGAAAQGKFNKTELRRMKTVVPPLAEQKKIISFLDEKNTSIEKSINTQRREISLLRDYKQSLITEVVTGKRKVV